MLKSGASDELAMQERESGEWRRRFEVSAMIDSKKMLEIVVLLAVRCC